MTFIGSIGMRRWSDHGAPRGDIVVEPWLRGPNGQLRVGVAAILSDLVIGIPPTGTTTSTVELSVRWTAEAPTAGRVTCAGRIRKWGQRLMFGEASLCDESGVVVGFAAGTFVSGEIGPSSDLTTDPSPWGGSTFAHRSVAEALQVEVRGPGELAMPMQPWVMNGPGGTVQGGIQACLAELAAEQALPGAYHVTDLAVRYFNRGKVGPILAVTQVLPSAGSDRSVLIEMSDAGNGNRPLSDALATIRPVESSAPRPRG